jgi:hypothetical protein
MEKIHNRDIRVTYHASDGFTLSYVTDEGDCYHRRYMDYSVSEAKKLFKEYAYAEDGKMFRCMTRDDVLVGALACICGGSRAEARKLLGNS